MTQQLFRQCFRLFGGGGSGGFFKGFVGADLTGGTAGSLIRSFLWVSFSISTHAVYWNLFVTKWSLRAFFEACGAAGLHPGLIDQQVSVPL